MDPPPSALDSCGAARFPWRAGALRIDVLADFGSLFMLSPASRATLPRVRGGSQAFISTGASTARRIALDRSATARPPDVRCPRHDRYPRPVAGQRSPGGRRRFRWSLQHRLGPICPRAVATDLPAAACRGGRDDRSSTTRAGRSPCVRVGVAGSPGGRASDRRSHVHLSLARRGLDLRREETATCPAGHRTACARSGASFDATRGTSMSRANPATSCATT